MTRESRAFHELSHIVNERRHGRIRLDGLAEPHERPLSKRFWGPVARLLTFVVTYIAILICGIFTAGLATDSKALSNNYLCGIWLPTTTSEFTPPAIQAQLDSADLFERCYFKEKGQDGCNYFAQQFHLRSSYQGALPIC